MSDGKFWLSVLEDSTKAEWPPTTEKQRWQVRLTASDTLLGCGHGGLFRTSPVFPLTPEFQLPNLIDGPYYMYFFCFDPAFPVLARLAQNAPPALRSGLMFNIGLASIMLISASDDGLNAIREAAGASPRATEVWTLVDSIITKSDCACSDPFPIGEKLLAIEPYDSLPTAAKAIVDEFVANIAVLVPKVAIHLPHEVETFLELVRLVNELLAEIVYVCNPVGDPPKTLSEYSRARIASDQSLVDKVVRQNTDRLVQVNAALSYVSTQGLSGAVPILDRRSLIRRHSLLGIGTAVLALTRLTHFIERAFASGAVDLALSKINGAKTGVVAGPIPGLDRLPLYDRGLWRKHSVNTWTKTPDGVEDGEETENRGVYPKLPYFSGRLGFRETEYTISAAIQTLAAGAGPEWSLLTVTHEILHGHVRNLISIAFQGDVDRDPDDNWNLFYDRFAATVYPEDKSASVFESESTGGPLTFLDSFRAVIYGYCCLAATHGSLTRDKGPIREENQLLLPEREELSLALQTELRNISEVFVHVLDLHYFYRSCLFEYVPAIWRSWAPLPQVKSDLRQYLLRTLLVVASKIKGARLRRFEQARRSLANHLGRIPTGGSGGATIQEAINRLGDDDFCQNHLFSAFGASIILVDFANEVLTSSAVRGSLHKGDPHFSDREHPACDEEWLEYDLPDGFVDDVVIAPNAYLADRLAKRIEEADSPMLERETAILFLACCSNAGGGSNG